MNRRTAVIDATGYRTDTTYNQRGDIVAVTNANGETVRSPKGFRTEFQSTFSLLGGCYLNFLPPVFSDKALHHLPNFLTPDEAHCNLRLIAVPSIHQHILEGNRYSWHLDCEGNEQSQILTDVRSAIGAQLLPLMNKFNDINRLLDLLESQNVLEVDIGICKSDSLNRHYLLGFTYLKLQSLDLAAQHLKKAKKLLDELLLKAAEPMSLKSDSPLLRQSENIIKALSALKSTQ